MNLAGPGGMRELVPPVPGAEAPRGWRRTFAALAHRNYRLWFFGQLVSMFGFWMQGTAQGFLVHELTRSSAYLGYVAFAAGVPTWLFMLYAGVVTDRVSRRRMLLVTQTAMMILAGILAALTFAEVVRPWHILVLSFGLGVCNAFDAPPRQALVMELVPRADVTNAIALNSTLFNAAVAVGPAAGGLIYAAAGPGWCFLINAVTYVPVIVALAAMRIEEPPPRPRGASALADIAEGIRYVRRHEVIRTLTALVGIVALAGMAFVTLLPAWAAVVLGGDAVTNGLLQSARGAGALASALVVASLGRDAPRGRWLLAGIFAFPLLLLLFSTLRAEILALAVLAAVGFALILMFNLSNALIQTEVEDRLRGRVLAVYSLTFFGLLPLGSLAAGGLAEALGEPLTVALSTAPLLLFALYVLGRVPALWKHR